MAVVPLDLRSNGAIAVPPSRARGATAAMQLTHELLRVVLGAHLWKLGFVAEQIEVPADARPEPDRQWRVRVTARRRALGRSSRRRRTPRGRLITLEVPCRVHRRLFGRRAVLYELPVHSGSPMLAVTDDRR